MMKSIVETSNKLAEVFIQLQAQLGGELMEGNKELTLIINNFLASGTIKGIIVEEAISFIEFDLSINAHLEFLYKIENALPIHFMYGSFGTINYGFQSNIQMGQIKRFQTGIFYNPSERSFFFGCEKNQKIKMSVITIDSSSIQDKNLKKELQDNFIQNNQKNATEYVSSLNVKIAEEINELNHINHEGLVRNLLLNSIIYRILALEIEQNKFDKKNRNSIDNLTNNNLQTISELANFIKKHPEKDHNLKDLCKQTALTPLKLQLGFKIIHNRTVTDFIRNCSVETAEKLIRNTELNISEIVYMIGFTSRSYFAKIFKEKYKCSPKEYKSNQKPLLLTA